VERSEENQTNSPFVSGWNINLSKISNSSELDKGVGLDELSRSESSLEERTKR